MDRADLVHKLHEVAAGLKKVEPVAPPAEGADVNLIDAYGFGSLDSLEFMLVLEEEFDVSFEDEDLMVDTLLSTNNLADYILAQRAGESAPAGP